MAACRASRITHDTVRRMSFLIGSDWKSVSAHTAPANRRRMDRTGSQMTDNNVIGGLPAILNNAVFDFCQFELVLTACYVAVIIQCRWFCMCVLFADIFFRCYILLFSHSPVYRPYNTQWGGYHAIIYSCEMDPLDQPYAVYSVETRKSFKVLNTNLTCFISSWRAKKKQVANAWNHNWKSPLFSSWRRQNDRC